MLLAYPLHITVQSQRHWEISLTGHDSRGGRTRVPSHKRSSPEANSSSISILPRPHTGLGGRMHNQQGQPGRAQHALGHAAQRQALQPAAPMRGESNQITPASQPMAVKSVTLLG